MTIEVGLILWGALSWRAGKGRGDRFRRQSGRPVRLLVARDEAHDARSTLPGGALEWPLLLAIACEAGRRFTLQGVAAGARCTRKRCRCLVLAR